jgi:4a-hydroxytetrahydrobiopterin dehydratase
VPRPPKLDADDVTRRLAALPGWTLRDGKLHRTFVFANFAAAFRFMTAVAAEAERLDHHPEWCNVYDRVTIDLVTHDASGLTALDFELAASAQRLAGHTA